MGVSAIRRGRAFPVLLRCLTAYAARVGECPAYRERNTKKAIDGTLAGPHCFVREQRTWFWMARGFLGSGLS